MKRKFEDPAGSAPPAAGLPPLAVAPQVEKRLSLADNCWLDFKPRLFSDAEAASIFEQLEELPWAKQKLRTPSGKKVDESCFTCYQGDRKSLTYAFTGSNRIPDDWTTVVLEVRTKVVEAFPMFTQGYFNTCFMNFFPDGKTALGSHTDQDIARYGPSTNIVSVSFGCARDFVLCRKDGTQTLRYSLGGGAALLMEGFVQEYWKHEVPKSANAGPRISLTFRHHLGGAKG